MGWTWKATLWIGLALLAAPTTIPQVEKHQIDFLYFGDIRVSIGQSKGLVLTMLRAKYTVSDWNRKIDLYNIRDTKDLRDVGSVRFENDKLVGASAYRALLLDGASVDEMWSALLPALSSLASSGKDPQWILLNTHWLDPIQTGHITFYGPHSLIELSYRKGGRDRKSVLSIEEKISAVPTATGR